MIPPNFRLKEHVATQTIGGCHMTAWALGHAAPGLAGTSIVTR